MAGLIKTVLGVEHGLIPPTPALPAPNPQIDFASSPFYVNARLAPWRPAGSAAPGGRQLVRHGRHQRPRGARGGERWPGLPLRGRRRPISRTTQAGTPTPTSPTRRLRCRRGREDFDHRLVVTSADVAGLDAPLEDRSPAVTSLPGTSPTSASISSTTSPPGTSWPRCALPEPGSRRRRRVRAPPCLHGRRCRGHGCPVRRAVRHGAVAPLLGRPGGRRHGRRRRRIRGGRGIGALPVPEALPCCVRGGGRLHGGRRGPVPGSRWRSDPAPWRRRIPLPPQGTWTASVACTTLSATSGCSACRWTPGPCHARAPPTHPAARVPVPARTVLDRPACGLGEGPSGVWQGPVVVAPAPPPAPR